MSISLYSSRVTATRYLSYVPVRARNFLFAAVAAAIAGCSSTPQQGLSGGGYYKVGTPYTVNGQRFVPREDPNYDRTGYASWYGDKFNGRQTANGEVFNMNALSAAHTTLPMPIHVRVTNLENGKSLVLRVNDRGPFVKDRIIDVSKQAAKELGFYQNGTAKVRVQYISRAPVGSYYAAKPKTTREEQRAGSAAPVKGVKMASLSPPPGTSAPQSVATGTVQPDDTDRAMDVSVTMGEEMELEFARRPPSQRFIRVGAFLNNDEAVTARARVQSLGNAEVQRETVDGQTYFLVMMGPLSSDREADKKLGALMKLGHSDARMVMK